MPPDQLGPCAKCFMLQKPLGNPLRAPCGSAFSVHGFEYQEEKHRVAQRDRAVTPIVVGSRGSQVAEKFMESSYWYNLHY
ncbi:Dual Specificity Mitogen-Activated Protein Kinase Kinase 1 [Manis pentadactyla]|nr:Dual Specificity Mitogen-Activated Protein Kinase Kinase 1 [Manis pentadactyla]